MLPLNTEQKTERRRVRELLAMVLVLEKNILDIAQYVQDLRKELENRDAQLGELEVDFGRKPKAN